MLKTYVCRVVNKLFKSSNYKTSSFDNYPQYVKIQYRCAPKEFLDSRLRIISSFVYILPVLERQGISNPVTHIEGVLAGQLIENKISILDAGSRDGWVVEFLNSLGYSNVIGVELLKDYVDYCKRMGRNVVLGDVHSLDFQDEEINFVYCRHVLEHCLDPVIVLNEMMRVTKVGGALYCSFPLDDRVSGKHTTAIPSLKSVSKILDQIKYKFDSIYIGRAKDTSVVIPEGDEAIIFIIKKSHELKKHKISHAQRGDL